MKYTQTNTSTHVRTYVPFSISISVSHWLSQPKKCILTVFFLILITFASLHSSFELSKLLSVSRDKISTWWMEMEKEKREREEVRVEKWKKRREKRRKERGETRGEREEKKSERKEVRKEREKREKRSERRYIQCMYISFYIHHIILHYTVLHYIILYYILLYNTKSNYVLSYCILLIWNSTYITWNHITWLLE